MEKLPYWNHNAAYYPRLKKRLHGCRRVLDVGCGDGTLARYLREPGRIVTGIDPAGACIARAQAACAGEGGLRFVCASFEDYTTEERFDAVLIVASLHHMAAEAALEKAKALLAPGGRLLVLGLAAPSSAADRLRDVCRLLPTRLGSGLHRMRSSEELGLPTSYELPPMAALRGLFRRLLPGAKLRHCLYWRYWLEWER